MGWISDSILWNIALPVKGYILDGMHSRSEQPHELIDTCAGRCDDHANTLPSEDSQATVCVPEESQTSGQDEQQPPSSQNLTCSVTESTCTATTTTVKRKGPPEIDVQPPVRPRKNVRISEFSCGAEAVPASTPHVKRSKKKEQRQQGTPYLDLRKMTSSKKAANSALEYEALDASGARKIAYVSSYSLRLATVDDSRRRVHAALRLRNCVVLWRALATTLRSYLYLSLWTSCATSPWTMLCASNLDKLTRETDSAASLCRRRLCRVSRNSSLSPRCSILLSLLLKRILHVSYSEHPRSSNIQCWRYCECTDSDLGLVCT